MSRFVRIHAVLLSLIATVSFLVPSVTAQDDAPSVAAPGHPIVELYLAGGALGGEMSPVRPTGEPSIKKSVIASAINPGAGTTVILGKFTPSDTFVFSGDVIINLWFVSNQATFYDQIQGRLVVGTTTRATASTTLGAGTIQTTPVNIRIALPTRDAEFAGGKEVRLEIVLFGLAASAATPTDLSILYGSATHPSGLSGAATSSPFPASSSALPVYLADKALTLEVPTSSDVKRRTVTTEGCTGHCAASSAGVLWGKVVATRDFTVTGPTVLTISAILSGTAGAARGLGGTLSLGKSNYAASLGTIASAYSSTTTSITYRLTFSTTGAEVKAGDEIGFTYQFWSTSQLPSGNIDFLYGSTSRPSGLVIPTLGGGGSAAEARPLLALTSETNRIYGAPGEPAASFVYLANDGSTPETVTLSSLGNATVVFDVDSVTIPGGNGTTVNFTVTAPLNETGSQFDFSILAKKGDAEFGNLTFTLFVSDTPRSDGTSSATSDPLPSTSSASPEADSTTSDGNATLKTQEAPVVVPGPWLPLVMLGIVALAWARRRVG